MFKKSRNLLFGPYKGMTLVPNLLNFDLKFRLFRDEVRRRNRGGGSISISVNRSHIFEESFMRLRKVKPSHLKGEISVKFKNEDGYDAGGLTREWFQVISREMFNPNYALFTMSHDCTYQPNHSSWVNPEHLEYFEFIGRVVGMAIVRGMSIDAHFTRSFYKHILGRPVGLRDMEAYDPQFHHSLCVILQEDVTDMDLYMSYDGSEFGKEKTWELVPGGSNIQVTNPSKKEYVQLLVNLILSTSIKPQVQAFTEGLYALVPKDLLRLFSPEELELVINGLPTVDVDDLRTNTHMQGFDQGDQHLEWFWRAVQELDEQSRVGLIQFVTGSSKVPLEGFAHLTGMRGSERPFTLQKIQRIGGLPSAHTCFNTLDLPCYSSFEELKKALETAITFGSEGFGFM
eukprot:TRINITY_DN11942_c0_g1_i1.p2 TRINITY_DN11942_c0_g1~~TRINITY_DN11942_c0_g1_i1.p2  ORF type:complete len:437 (-),score=83.02 TRINITY_DN11942_c0_g1_i1:1349-2548(-)